MQRLKLINKFLFLNFFVFTAYILIDVFQIYLLTGLKAQSSEGLVASYIYLPHGLRVILAIIFGPITFFGLLTAHIYTGFKSTLEINNLILLSSLLSTIVPYLSVFLLLKKFKIKIYEIKLISIILISILSAFLNAFFSVLSRFFYNFYEEAIFTVKFFKFFIGDVLGVLFLFLLIILLNLLNKIFTKTK